MERNEPGDNSPRDPDDDHLWRRGPEPRADVPEWWSYLGGDEEDDDADDLFSATAPLPLPPEDRLWRHPSEIHNVAPTPLVAESRPSRSNLVAATVAAGLTGAMLAGVAIWLIGPTRERITERVIERQLVEAPTAFVNTSLGGIDVVTIAETVRPSIVRVEILTSFGEIQGSGSGVIFRDDGHVLTNAHVIDGASRIEVVLSDGSRLPAEAIGSDQLTDVAVIKIDSPDSLPTMLMGTTTGLRVGEAAVAIGSPLRLAGGPTVTLGVVSAIGRTLDLPNGGRLYDMVQTDAPISPGSSGGALVDGSGALIGITTVVAVSEIGAEGLGFATPVDIAYDVAIELLVDGEVHHGFLGIGGDDLTSAAASEFDIDGGALITAVGSGTPAESAGLRSGDIITSVDGETITSMGGLVVRIRRIDPGESAVLEVIRDGAKVTISARLSTRPA